MYVNIYIYTNVCVDIFQAMHSKWHLYAILFSSLISDKKIEQVFSHRSAASNILSASCFSPASFTDSMHLSCDPNLFHHWNITIESKERFLACRKERRLKHRTIGPSWRVQGHYYDDLKGSSWRQLAPSKKATEIRGPLPLDILGMPWVWFLRAKYPSTPAQFSVTRGGGIYEPTMLF